MFDNGWSLKYAHDLWPLQIQGKTTQQVKVKEANLAKLGAE